MNNSLPRLYEGMADTLAQRILPHIGDDFARGQAYGVIYLLRCLSLRTDWSADYVQPQWEALQAASERLRPLLRQVVGAPSIEPATPDGATLHERCEAARVALCAAYDWSERHASDLAPPTLAAIRDAWQRYMEADLKSELRLRVPLPYSEMSSGQASTDTEANA
ncbi:MAG TPA: hypothetical protein VLJ86_18575 [Ramlibacter sp.]|nr:hypothetical protein [Ramlibacter sp.]